MVLSHGPPVYIKHLAIQVAHAQVYRRVLPSLHALAQQPLPNRRHPLQHLGAWLEQCFHKATGGLADQREVGAWQHVAFVEKVGAAGVHNKCCKQRWMPVCTV